MGGKTLDDNKILDGNESVDGNESLDGNESEERIEVDPVHLWSTCCHDDILNPQFPYQNSAE